MSRAPHDYPVLSTPEAIAVVDASRAQLSSMGLGDLFPAILDNLHDAVQKREQAGFMIDPRSRVDVLGCARAVLAGQNADHMRAEVKELGRYLSAYVQIDATSRVEVTQQ